MDRVNYEVIGPGKYKFEIKIWEENGTYFYSRDNDVDELIDVSVDVMEQKIDALRNAQIKPGERVIDPYYYVLSVVDRNGGEMHFEWSDDDKIPRELDDFIEFIG